MNPPILEKPMNAAPSAVAMPAIFKLIPLTLRPIAVSVRAKPVESASVALLDAACTRPNAPTAAFAAEFND